MVATPAFDNAMLEREQPPLKHLPHHQPTRIQVAASSFSSKGATPGSVQFPPVYDDDGDYDFAASYATAAASAGSSACPHIGVKVHWCRPILPQLELKGEFARRLEWCFRIMIASIISITISVYSPVSSHLVAAFLCPVLAVLSCGPTLGASINAGWQCSKGVFYASFFGWICAICGVGYQNDSRLATFFLLFAFSAWTKYFLPLNQLTAQEARCRYCRNYSHHSAQLPTNPSLSVDDSGNLCVGVGIRNLRQHVSISTPGVEGAGTEMAAFSPADVVSLLPGCTRVCSGIHSGSPGGHADPADRRDGRLPSGES